MQNSVTKRERKKTKYHKDGQEQIINKENKTRMISKREAQQC